MTPTKITQQGFIAPPNSPIPQQTSQTLLSRKVQSFAEKVQVFITTTTAYLRFTRRSSHVLDKLGQAVFTVRKGVSQQYIVKKTTYIDIESEHLRVILSFILKDSCVVSLKENKLSVSHYVPLHGRQ
jgi:hypothetical protein